MLYRAIYMCIYSSAIHWVYHSHLAMASSPRKFFAIFYFLCLAFLLFSAWGITQTESVFANYPCPYWILIFFGLSFRRFFFFFFFAEIQLAEANVCQRASKTWHGPCLNTGSCKNQCISVEHAVFGACHGLTCYCYFNCWELTL